MRWPMVELAPIVTVRPVGPLRFERTRVVAEHDAGSDEIRDRPAHSRAVPGQPQHVAHPCNRPWGHARR